MSQTPSEQHHPAADAPAPAPAPAPPAPPDADLASAAVPPRLRRADRVAKETLESVLIALVFALVFRAYIVEAFIIPTGSMTPTLLGAHGPITCHACGYRFPLAASGGTVRGDGQFPAVCPMCNFPTLVPGGTPVSSGDRILVHKYLYTFTQPRRWDVTVFKAPHQPADNYIKRLVGLPGEELAIIDGDLYTKPLDAPDADFHIQRKTDPASNRHWKEIQRAVFQPIYHSEYVPIDRGQSTLRLQVERATGSDTSWMMPWRVEAGAERGAGGGEGREIWDMSVNGGRSYAFLGRGEGRLVYDFDATAELSPEQEYPFNQDTRRPSFVDPLEDVRLAVSVQPMPEAAGGARGAGLTLTLQTSARLDNPAAGSEPIRATLAPDGSLSVTAGIDSRQRGLTNGLGTDLAKVGPLPVGHATPVELWHVDGQISVWVDGEQVFRHDIDVPFATVARRPRPDPHPAVAIEVAGVPVVLHRVQLDRDLYYGSRDAGGTLARGARERTRSGELLQPVERVLLGPDEFFLVGDNGPQSLDGRFWSDVDPWVRERLGGDLRPGIVRRRLLIGRAFFVYFPAPHRAGRLPIPNFGKMRFIH